MEQGNKVEPKKPVEPKKTVEPKKPVEPKKTVEPPKPVESKKPVETPKPVDIAKPVESKMAGNEKSKQPPPSPPAKPAVLGASKPTDDKPANQNQDKKPDSSKLKVGAGDIKKDVTESNKQETKQEKNAPKQPNKEEEKVVHDKKDEKVKQIKKPNETFYKTIKIVGNVLFIPFFLIILFSTILMFSAKVRNEVPSLFGYSAVKILSGSMADGIDEDYNEGDVVLVKACDPTQLNEGDIIAFYEPIITRDEDELESVQTTQVSANVQTTLLSFLGGGVSNDLMREAAQSYSRVIFHRIVDIRTPSNPADEYYGKLFFQTKGDRNGSPDTNWVMQDYVVGVYLNTNGFVGNLFQFCTTTAGMIVMIILPSLIIIALLSLDIYNESKRLRYERQIQENVTLQQEKILNEITNKPQTQTKEQQQIEKKKEEMLKEILDEAKTKENKSKPKIETSQVKDKKDLTAKTEPPKEPPKETTKETTKVTTKQNSQTKEVEKKAEKLNQTKK